MFLSKHPGAPSIQTIEQLYINSISIFSHNTSFMDAASKKFRKLSLFKKYKNLIIESTGEAQIFTYLKHKSIMWKIPVSWERSPIYRDDFIFTTNSLLITQGAKDRFQRNVTTDPMSSPNKMHECVKCNPFSIELTKKIKHKTILLLNINGSN